MFEPNIKLLVVGKVAMVHYLDPVFNKSTRTEATYIIVYEC